jgi:hypothetical protein
MKHVPHLANHCIGKERLVEIMHCTDQPFRGHLTIFDGLFRATLARQGVYSDALLVRCQQPPLAGISGE